MRTALLAATVLGCALIPAGAADLPLRPSPEFCQLVRDAIVAAGSEKAAEDIARANGASAAFINAAKRCVRS